jgi:hypothetical protein
MRAFSELFLGFSYVYLMPVVSTSKMGKSEYMTSVFPQYPTCAFSGFPHTNIEDQIMSAVQPLEIGPPNLDFLKTHVRSSRTLFQDCWQRHPCLRFGLSEELRHRSMSSNPLPAYITRVSISENTNAFIVCLQGGAS